MTLRRSDYFWLSLSCLALFGLGLVGGRPLSMHEGVLPQTSREMMVDHDWVVPKNDGRPWLENPPLPQWITVAVASVVGRCDKVWIVRIPPLLAALGTVLLVAWMAAGWFGRAAGVLSGITLATMYEFIQYAWRSEDEMFLGALVTLAVAAFVRLEFSSAIDQATEPTGFFGLRARGTLAFFIALGLTNLAKGPLFGTAMVVAPAGLYLLWNADLRRIRRYFWLWGWLVFTGLAVAWPVAAYLREPGVTGLWEVDYLGRMGGSYEAINKPPWYYLGALAANLVPWTLVALYGLWLARGKAFSVRASPERFLWCWALAPLLLFSIPQGKHHHYLLPCLAPWAVFTGVALLQLHARFFRASASRRRVVFGVLFAVVAVAYGAGHVAAGVWFDQTRDDTRFLQRVREMVPPDRTLLVNADLGDQLENFRLLFYLPATTRTLVNLTFLADDTLPRDEVYLITRAKDRAVLARYGEAESILQSARTRRENSPDDRFTLFRLRFRENLPRASTRGIRITPMQAMGRAPAPDLVPQN
ncbi:MAG: glycosyltransferase family 39 protein [Chthoniobacterales bacterium]